MDYWILTKSVSIPEIGDYPQVEPIIIPPYNVWDKNKLYSLSLWEEIHPDFELPEFRLKKQAKITDFVSCIALNTNEALLINEKTNDILKKYFSDDSREIETYVNFKEIRIPYYYRYLNKINNDFIDFENSSFVIFNVKKYPNSGKLTKFNDASEYTKYIQSLADPSSIIVYDRIVLNSNIKKHIFRIRGTYSGVFVSEAVVDVLLKNKITGYRIVPLDILYNNPKYLAGHYTIEK